MSKSVREHIQEILDSYHSGQDLDWRVGVTNRAMLLVKSNAALFAAAEENAAEVARLRGVMAAVADLLSSNRTYTSDVQAAHALRAALQPQPVENGGEG